jgi:hypothetical protein
MFTDSEVLHLRGLFASLGYKTDLLYLTERQQMGLKDSEKLIALIPKIGSGVTSMLSDFTGTGSNSLGNMWIDQSQVHKDSFSTLITNSRFIFPDLNESFTFRQIESWRFNPHLAEQGNNPFVVGYPEFWITAQGKAFYFVAILTTATKAGAIGGIMRGLAGIQDPSHFSMNDKNQRAAVGFVRTFQDLFAVLQNHWDNA